MENNTSDASTPITQAVPQTPPATTEAAPPPQDAPSIDAHADAFGPGPKGETTEERTARQEAAAQRTRDNGRFAPERHRSRKNQASAEDVPRIRELTAKWREEEKRSTALAEKYAALEKEVATLKAPKPVEVPPQPKPFDADEPKLEDFASYDDPYQAHGRALAKYDRMKEAAEAAKAQHSTAQSQAQQAQQQHVQQQYQQLYGDYKTRAAAFMQANPQFATVVPAQFGADFPPVLYAAILEDERGPEFVLHLATKSALHDEAVLLAEGKPVTEDFVARMRRLLSARVPGVTTGSSATQSAYVPPKPPNPVRTGPMKSVDEPPSEAGSIADHARYFGRRR